MSPLLPPFTETNADWLRHITENLTPEQLVWLSGYSYGLSRVKTGVSTALPSVSTSSEEANTAIPLTILYGSHTGNGKKIAARVAEHAHKHGLKPLVHDMSDYPLKNLKQEKNLLLVVSTHGEGDPPIAAEDVYAHLHSARAPKLHETSFSVLALGDKSYLHFCKTGADFDIQLEKLGANRLTARVDCDVDFEDDAEVWIEATLKALLNKAGEPATSNTIAKGTNGHTNGYGVGFANGHSPAGTSITKKNPFAAPLLEKIQLNGRGSQKETYHLEFSLENSGLVYEPGDALGVYAENAPALVEEVLSAANVSGEIQINLANTDEASLFDTLTRNFELTLLTREVLTKHNDIAQSNELTAILGDNARLKSFLYGNDVVDMLRTFPIQHTQETLLATLRRLPSRLYSIASSLKEHEEEVHIIAQAVRYEAGGRHKQGLASCFLADRRGVDERVNVYIDRNDSFKLPQNAATDIIMVGPGTGIAPFRSFVEERANDGSTGKNWLFFGNPHFTTDFLYQTEWQQWLKKGVLARLDLAFSRDQAEKIYVQHKLLASSKNVFAWLESGASLYVCGDKDRMAHDVEAALTLIVQRESGTTPEKAAAYIKSLKKQRRYLEDVY